MRRVCLLIALLAGCVQANAILYVKDDSVKVVKLLQEGAAQPKGTNLMLWYGHQFVSRPYVSHTLEVSEEEQLAVNLGSLDCTTLVETVTALTLATQHGGKRWQDYTYWLQRIRYRDGKLDGYCSRNHYFTQWIESNERLGIVAEVHSTAAEQFYPFTHQQMVNLHYMTDHPESYPLLKKNLQERKKIGVLERASSNKKVRYIPASLLGEPKQKLKYVHDGDIIAIVTKKDGLDVSHVGIAEWCKDGKLHLLNASSIHKKVVLEPMTLQQYMSKHPSQLGIRVIRLK